MTAYTLQLVPRRDTTADIRQLDPANLAGQLAASSIATYRRDFAAYCVFAEIPAAALSLPDMIREVRQEERARRQVGSPVKLSRAERARQAAALAANLPSFADLVAALPCPGVWLRDL